MGSKRGQWCREYHFQNEFGNTRSSDFGSQQHSGAAIWHAAIWRESWARSTDYRLFAKYFDFNRSPNLPGRSAPDDWHVLRGGFRADQTLSPADTLATEGDIYTGRKGSMPSLALRFLPRNVVCLQRRSFGRLCSNELETCCPRAMGHLAADLLRRL